MNWCLGQTADRLGGQHRPISPEVDDDVALVDRFRRHDECCADDLLTAGRADDTVPVLESPAYDLGASKYRRTVVLGSGPRLYGDLMRRVELKHRAPPPRGKE